MADVFEERPELNEHRARLFDLIEKTPELDWQILTKRPEFARDWLRGYYETYHEDARLPFLREWTSRDGLGWGVLPNVWIGVSVENTRWTWRVDVLRQIPAAVRFISAEPLLQSLFNPAPAVIDVAATESDPGEGRNAASRPMDAGVAPQGRGPLDLEGIDWLIVGGESGSRKARPMNPEWTRELRDAALREGIAFHFKQAGARLAREWGCSSRAGSNPSEWPEEFRIQELPGVLNAA